MKSTGDELNKENLTETNRKKKLVIAEKQNVQERGTLLSFLVAHGDILSKITSSLGHKQGE